IRAWFQRHRATATPTSSRWTLATRVSTASSSSGSRRRESIAGRCANHASRTIVTGAFSTRPPPPSARDSGRVCGAVPSWPRVERRRNSTRCRGWRRRRGSGSRRARRKAGAGLALTGAWGGQARRYEGRVYIEGHVGVLVVENSAADSHLIVEISESWLPVLMPLISGLRRVFDLDAEPAVIDAHLSASGLAEFVRRWPGVRVPGISPDAFDATDRVLQRTAGVTSAQALLTRAECWRPWRAYAAQLL